MQVASGRWKGQGDVSRRFQTDPPLLTPWFHPEETHSRLATPEKQRKKFVSFKATRAGTGGEQGAATPSIAQR